MAKRAIEDLKEAVRVAKEKQVTTQAEIEKLEKDMGEFKNNKEGKIEELRVCEPLLSGCFTLDCLQTNISKQKSAIQKHNVVMKTQQKEMQTVTLELGRLRILLRPRFLLMGVEQLEVDLATSEQTVVDIKASSGVMHQELQDQYTQRDEIAVRIAGYHFEEPYIDSLAR